MSDESRLTEIIAVVESQSENTRTLSANDAKWLIEQCKKSLQYEEFLSACRFAGEGGLPLLRKEATRLLRGKDEVVNCDKVLRN